MVNTLYSASEELEQKAKEAFSNAYREALEGGRSTAISKGGKVIEQWLCDELVWEEVIADVPSKCYIREKVKRGKK